MPNKNGKLGITNRLFEKCFYKFCKFIQRKSRRTTVTSGTNVFIGTYKKKYRMLRSDDKQKTTIKNKCWLFFAGSTKNTHCFENVSSDIVTMYINYKQELNDPQSAQYAIENLIRSLTQSSLDNPQDISTWVLLYCIYKKHNYLPGMEYCRWKYQNLYRNILLEMPYIPQSRWDIYLAHKLEFKSQKGQHFYQVVHLFVSMGLYQFAEWVFDEIASESMEVEKYFMFCTFKIFLNKLELKFAVKNFPVEKFLNPFYLRATLSQVNGNLEYFRNSSSTASMKHYSIICDINDLNNRNHFNLGLFRYAYRMMEEKEYTKAKQAFSVCCSEEGDCFVAAIGKGKACYRLEDLDAAEQAFAQSTRYGLYMPNVWAYLALINIRKGENYRALECWKYARLNPNDDIHPEILHELNKINYRDVNLYVDIPEMKTNSG